ncbi:hypothetical protein FB451DRAFT_478877 [Mycena latifolia]|nr:hypothetical protein FB451DRAFT_478877 [Mycena latifolia]
MTAADLRRRVTELDAQIVEQKLVLNQQRLVLEELERIRTATEHELRATATYPVLTLPFEVTAHIFVQCLPLYEYEDDYNPSFSMAQQLRETAPLVLLGVCRAWKDIVLAMPKLWSTLRIRFDSFPDPVTEEPGLIEGFVDRWLGRAENCPLSLVFSLYETDNPSWPTRIRRIIRHYSHRLWHFKLGMYEEDIPKLRLHRTSFPLLESATLSTACGEGDPELIHLFSNAPRLRDFRVAREEAGPELRYLSLPWLQLTKFEGKIDNMDLFSQALNLTEAIIETLLDMDPDDDPPTTVITHSNLTSLTLYAAGGSGTLNVLEYLTLPVLQSLDISEADPASYPSLRSLGPSADPVDLC